MCLRVFFSSTTLLTTLVLLIMVPQIYLAGNLTENSNARWVVCDERFDLVSSTDITCVQSHGDDAILLKCPMPIKNCRRHGDEHNLVADPEGATNPKRFQWNSTECEKPFFEPKWEQPTAITKYFRYAKSYYIFVLGNGYKEKLIRCEKQNNTNSVECYANPKDMQQLHILSSTKQLQKKKKNPWRKGKLIYFIYINFYIYYFYSKNKR
ncbi:hypothetical protein BY996DRAFT_7986736 [Phakopsora pachyrhizi]|nr:hypothetical protein BY996DRAFT_7986736 [Phakopsora pachyrhizi]